MRRKIEVTFVLMRCANAGKANDPIRFFAGLDEFLVKAE